MVSRPASSAPEAVFIDDVINGIVGLPMPARDRIGLLREFYNATAKVENGQCIIEGPFREKLHRFFSDRHKSLRSRRQHMQKSRLKADREIREIDKAPLTMYEEEELARIVTETRGNFDQLEHAFDTFGKNLTDEIERDVRSRSDAAGIREARNTLDGKPKDAPPSQKPDDFPRFSNS